MGRKLGFSFSWKRLTGISAAKARLSRQIGIPLTRSGRQRKLGREMGCCIPFAIVALAGLSLFAVVARADRIKLTGDRELTGVIIEQDDDWVKIRTRGGTLRVPRGQVISIEKIEAAGGSSLLPKWDGFMAPTASAPWAAGIRQIPATVIDNGILKFVPYMSYQAGDYELNIYGDPDSPAGVEIGIRNDLLKKPTAKANCIKFISDIVRDPRFGAALRTMNMQKDTKEIDGITIEITPETDPDAYGGWWISVYSVSKLDQSRATPAELAKITVKKSTVADAASTKPTGVALAPKLSGRTDDSDDPWTREDIRRSRTTASSSSSPSSPTSSSSSSTAATPDGGSVYVRSYTRKDGTFVRSYTRSAPGHGGGRR